MVDAPDPDFTYTGISFFLFDLNRLIKVRQQIDEQLRAVGQLENGQKSTEWENQVFQRSKSREEYIKLVATLILKLRDYGKKVSHCFWVYFVCILFGSLEVESSETRMSCLYSRIWIID